MFEIFPFLEYIEQGFDKIFQASVEILAVSRGVGNNRYCKDASVYFITTS